MVQTPPSPIVINHLCFSFAVFLEYWCFIFALSFEDKRSPWIPSPLLFPISPRERLHFHRVNGKYPVCIQFVRRGKLSLTHKPLTMQNNRTSVESYQNLIRGGLMHSKNRWYVYTFSIFSYHSHSPNGSHF